ncbi:S26 family signal peptidase [Natrinema sp. 1APR25-10V2]|uniref:S26 family signal peptidase n=1 Tax=Natrinema sp. 1APR25-10V2 TaxID=2951081 RepID=UPI0028760CB1|nr:S26 family signal peptidase [Natrinema sp. 1APR25-10V2]MDS0476170.1 S26 family signal peptidase [Natrinema sp. 1APR25-10V2]
MSGSSSGSPPDDPGDDDGRQDSSAGASRASSGPSRSAPDPDAVTIEDDGVVRWFLETDDENVIMVRDVLSSVAIVAVVGLLLFGISGIWPPLVAVESGSMEPHMERGDLIFITEEGRFAGDGAVQGTGVVTYEQGKESGYRKYGKAGDVIVFKPNGSERTTPVIHRAHFWVEDNESWVETKASEEIVGDATCEEIASCPAPHAGFITKGDNNAGYDQLRRSGARTTVVKPEWITGKAKVRIPWLGHVRLTFDKLLGGMLVPTSPSSPPLQGSAPAATAMTAAPESPGAPSSGLDSEFAGMAAVAGVGTAAAASRYRR